MIGTAEREINQSKHPIKKTAERKILVVFHYYIVLTVIAVTAYTLSNRNGDTIKEELTKYFLCESIGPESPCDTSAYRDLYHAHRISALGYWLIPSISANICHSVSNYDMKQ